MQVQRTIDLPDAIYYLSATLSTMRPPTANPLQRTCRQLHRYIRSTEFDAATMRTHTPSSSGLVCTITDAFNIATGTITHPSTKRAQASISPWKQSFYQLGAHNSPTASHITSPLPQQGLEPKHCRIVELFRCLCFLARICNPLPKHNRLMQRPENISNAFTRPKSSRKLAGSHQSR